MNISLFDQFSQKRNFTLHGKHTKVMTHGETYIIITIIIAAINQTENQMNNSSMNKTP